MVSTIVKAATAASKVIDVLERASGRNRDVPPYSLRRLIGAPPGDFSGKEYRAEWGRFKPQLIEAGLRDGVTVGEIGCGCGRMAAPLLQEFDVKYCGFDIVPALIEWAKTHIEPSYPNATFELFDLWNARYNPNGATRSENLTFPFADRTCDLIYASSVFTHILTDTTVRYLSEIKRTLAPGGRAVLTVFLLDIKHPSKKHGDALAASGVDARLLKRAEFAHGDGQLARYVYPDIPELMVGYNLDDLCAVASKLGLNVTLQSAGSWRDGGPSRSWQDIIVVE